MKMLTSKDLQNSIDQAISYFNLYADLQSHMNQISLALLNIKVDLCKCTKDNWSALFSELNLIYTKKIECLKNLTSYPPVIVKTYREGFCKINKNSLAALRSNLITCARNKSVANCFKKFVSCSISIRPTQLKSLNYSRFRAIHNCSQ